MIKKVIGLIACSMCLLGVLLLFSAGMVEGDLPKLALASLVTIIGGVIAVITHLIGHQPLHHEE